MKRRLALLAVAALAWSATPARAASAPLHSDNVSLLTTLPEAVGAASARFSGHYMYVSTWKGLLIYDIAKPEAPQRVSFLPLPHFENEDVDAGNGLVIISNDPSEGLGVVYVIDVHNPALPKILAAVPNGTIAGDLGDLNNNGSATGHIANCIKACRYLWLTGTSQGLSIYDLRNPASPQFVKLVPMPKRKALPGEDPSTIRPGFTHDVHVDSSGIGWVTGEDGTFGFDTRDPVNPKLIYRSDENVINSGQSGPSGDGAGPLDFLHHNSMRLSSSVMAITEEDYTRPTCKGQGSVQTWQITSGHNSDGSRKLTLMDSWTTELNELQSTTGRSPATVLCSAHWFDVNRGMLAQGWYDQGVRFLDASNPRDIRQVGYWVTQGTFWAAYFAPTDRTGQTVYGLNATGGIDVLHIARRSGAPPTRAPIPAEWLAPVGFVYQQPSAKWGFSCPVPTAAALAQAGV